ncbi:MAG: cadherin domain-containing protein, partial [Gallionella sp.]
VPLGQIESTLKGPPEGSPGANVYVPYPLSTSATKTPRLDVYHALQQRDRAPTGVSMPAVALNEGTDTTVGVEVGTLTAMDPDSCDHFSFSIVGGADAAHFAISGSANDRLRLTAGVLDYETKTSYAVIVRITDFNGLSFDQPLTVNVTDLNDTPPVITTPAAHSVNENTAFSVPLSATDVDTVGISPANFSISGGADAAKFSIVGTNLTMTAKDYEAPSDADANSTYVVQISASDGVNSVTKIITVTVNDVNDTPPVITTPTTFNVNENVAFSVPLSSTDVDTVGINPANFIISSGADAGQFSIVATNLTMMAKNYEAPADANTNNTYVVQVSANDGVNTAVSTITVTVINVNDAPTGRPYIDGVRTVGQTLTARTSTSTLPNPIADEDGLGVFHYHWLRGSTPVGADSDTYTLVAADLGAYMAVCVTYTDGGGQAEQVCSGADARAVGDPHLITVDGLHYDFQSAGEFVALRGRNGLEIQTRHTPVSTASAISDPYSGLTAA